MASDQLAPVLFARATRYRLNGRVRFPTQPIGTIVAGPDEDFVVFRKMVLEPAPGQYREPQALFTVRFRFSRFSSGTNRRLSLLPAPLIAAQPGFRSKTWMLGQSTGMFQGSYEWDSVEEARAYWTSLPMRLMKRRAIAETLWYEVAAI